MAIICFFLDKNVKWLETVVVVRVECVCIVSEHAVTVSFFQLCVLHTTNN